MAELMNRTLEEETVEVQDLPWLIFTLSNNAYAVNSKYVSGILMPPEVTPLPEASEIYKGLVDIRGEVFPLLEMRKLFRFKTIEEESSQIEEKLENYKQAHVNWIAALKKSINEDEPFVLAKDPTKCDFGKWYYNEIAKATDEHLVSLKKVEEPHRLLHETANKVLDLKAHNKDGEKNAEIASLMKIATDNYVPIILGLIDEAKRTYRNSYRETVVHLSNNEESLGLLVDEVLAIDNIEMVSDDRSMNKIVDSRYFCGVAHNSKIKKEILIIDEDLLLKKAKV